MKIIRSVALAGALFPLAFANLCAAAETETAAAIAVASDVRYEPIGHWDVDKLNQILTKDFPAFSGLDVSYTPATNGVTLYRVSYDSVIPDKGNKPIRASGLLAVPDTGGKAFPLLSYQHGTVYEREQVPSFPDQSPETQLMLAQFAGQGYVVIGADYFGMGTSKEPEGYMVKSSHQQACHDMIRAAGSVLGSMGITTDKLVLGGWSQGGFVTMACLEKLESAGVTVNAAATASAPVDVYALMNGFLFFPRPIDASWLNTIVILTAFAYENYYGVPGLARSVLNDEYYDAAKRFYEREPVDATEVTSDLKKLIRADYFDPQFFAASAYGRLLAQTHAYRWIVQSPVRNYFGEADEAITTGVGEMAMTYQQAMGTGNKAVEAISTGETDHRGTYAKAVPEWKIWFDGQ
jgi:pimeloyl-ACP methyl ester carboxylesterase